MKTNLSLFGSSSLRGGGRVLDPICTMSLYLPFFGFDGAPYTFSSFICTSIYLYPLYVVTFLNKNIETVYLSKLLLNIS